MSYFERIKIATQGHSPPRGMLDSAKGLDTMNASRNAKRKQFMKQAQEKFEHDYNEWVAGLEAKAGNKKDKKEALSKMNREVMVVLADYQKLYR